MLYQLIPYYLQAVHRGSYISAHVLLNLSNELGKGDNMRDLPGILSLFRNELYTFNNTGARMLDSIYLILSSEISAYQKQIKVILITSEMI